MLNYKDVKNITALIINIININLLSEQLFFKRKKTQPEHLNNIYYQNPIYVNVNMFLRKKQKAESNKNPN